MYSITKMCYSKNDISAVYLFLSDLYGDLLSTAIYTKIETFVAKYDIIKMR